MALLGTRSRAEIQGDMSLSQKVSSTCCRLHKYPVYDQCLCGGLFCTSRGQWRLQPLVLTVCLSLCWLCQSRPGPRSSYYTDYTNRTYNSRHTDISARRRSPAVTVILMLTSATIDLWHSFSVGHFTPAAKPAALLWLGQEVYPARGRRTPPTGAVNRFNYEFRRRLNPARPSTCATKKALLQANIHETQHWHALWSV